MNFYAVGFVAVLGVAGIGVDYHQQSVKAGVGLGQLGPKDYVDTITARIDGAKAEKLAEAAESDRKAAWKEGGKPFLPEAPAGWVRRGFDEGDNTAIIPAQRRKLSAGEHAQVNYLAAAKLAPGESVSNSEAGSGIANLMGQRSAADIVRDVATRSWVYERGEETVFIEIKTRKAPSLKSLVGNVSASIKASAAGMGGRDAGYAVIGGVGFTEALDINGKRANHYRILSGKIGFGQEIHIRVHANASSAATREILAAIDYDGLNALLKNPMVSVGNGMTPPDVPEEKLAVAMLDLRREFEGLLAQEAQYRVQNLNASALMINTLAQGYGAGVDGVTDLTGGKVVNMETLIRAGYRKGMRDLMEGRDGRLALGEVGQVFGAAVSQHQAQAAADASDQPAPQAASMSPALAAELGLLTAVKTPEARRGSQPPINMLDFDPDALTAQEKAWIEKHADAGDRVDGPDQEAARVMELRRGLPPGNCLMDHKMNKIHCNENAEGVRQDRRAVAAAPASQSGGGFMSKLSGLFGGGGGSGGSRASGGGSGSSKVEIRRMGGGGTRIASGGGCGGGKFCQANE